MYILYISYFSGDKGREQANFRKIVPGIFCCCKCERLTRREKVGVLQYMGGTCIVREIPQVRGVHPAHADQRILCVREASAPTIFLLLLFT